MFITPPEKALLPVSGQQFGCFSVRENVSQCAVESQAQLEQRGQLGTTQVFCTLLIILERRLGKDFYPMFQSITVDNGCEFQDYDGMEKACRRKGKRTTVYYCHPHAPHERGSNENMNRIIRRFFPKGTNFDEVPISEIRRAEEWMNNYPREVLGWQTAATLLRSYMSAC